MQIYVLMFRLVQQTKRKVLSARQFTRIILFIIQALRNAIKCVKSQGKFDMVNQNGWLNGGKKNEDQNRNRAPVFLYRKHLLINRSID